MCSIAYLRERRPYKRFPIKNFICVDWGSVAIPVDAVPLILNAAWLPLIVQFVPAVARRIADLLIFLKQEDVLTDYEDVHLIGISLGAHVIGSVGYIIQQRTNTTLGRITGLDPSGKSLCFNQV